MDNVAVPIFLRLGKRMRGPEGTEIGSIRDVMISNVYARFPKREYPTTPICLPGERNAGETNIPFEYPSMIVGVTGAPIRNVTLRDVHLVTYGGHTQEEAMPLPLPARDEAYPNPNMFGARKVMPVSGLLCRHVSGLKLYHVTLETLHPDERPLRLIEDTDDLSEA
jgi:hypothetical protein